jgi:CubicO group peptidase (beta-lactamase class C family)
MNVPVTRTAWSSLVLLAILGAASSSVAQQARRLTSGPAASVGMDDATLQDAVKLYRDALQKGEIRGAVLLVARHGKIVVHEAMGWKHEAYRLPMEKDTLFRMQSTTKPIVATAALILEDEGKLKTRDPVATYLESFQNEKSGPITIHHLLSGSSGLRIAPILYPFDKDDPRPTLRKGVDKFGKEGPAVELGTSFSYSNAAFNAVGAVVEQAAGMPLEDFLVQRIYKPLGMVDSLNHEDPTKLHRMATAYNARVKPGGGIEWTQGWTPGDGPEWPVVRASGGLVSTAMDYATFLQMYIDGGRSATGQVVSRESVKKATSPYVRVAACPPAAAPCNTLTPFGTPDGSYGYGWFVSDAGVFSHLGGSSNNGVYVWGDPARDLIGVALTSGGHDPRRAFQALVERACTSK